MPYCILRINNLYISPKIRVVVLRYRLISINCKFIRMQEYYTFRICPIYRYNAKKLLIKYKILLIEYKINQQINILILIINQRALPQQNSKNTYNLLQITYIETFLMQNKQIQIISTETIQSSLDKKNLRIQKQEPRAHLQPKHSQQQDFQQVLVNFHIMSIPFPQNAIKSNTLDIQGYILSYFVQYFLYFLQFRLYYNVLDNNNLYRNLHK
eukprot:TRINITY_DN11488_c0_g2_i4.p1 TRINITY_DN11488_c0_g2~~TRINITY_DN11488_c0_g2_i4.p1  ORF type:complete len:212 (+),score=-31.52 TRINITY_DN11488_c0_g2_i4:354-989(+)